MSDSRPVWITLRVSDVESSGRFYREVVGIPLGESHAHEPENEIHQEAYWENGGGSLLGLSLYPAGAGHPPGVQISYTVDDLDAVHAVADRLDIGVVEPPCDTPYGPNACYEDPDGNVVSVTQRPR